jgi:ABC-type phosphate/phosphonate transport system substrate-binding protein
MLRFVKVASLAAVLAFITGCQGGARVASIGKPAVHVGSTKIGAVLLPAEFRALHPELEKLFNQPVVFDPYLNGEMIGKQLDGGYIQFAVLTAREYAETPVDSKAELVASGLNSDGKPARKGLIIAKASSNLQTVADCKGQRFAFGPANDLLLDNAARAALEKAGVTPADLKKELPPLSLDGRLHCPFGAADVAKNVAFDGGIACGVIDEMTWNAMPATGGSILAGASKDQLRVIGETEAVAELVVVASPKTDPAKVQLLREYLLSGVKSNPEVCKQMGVSGFGAADSTLYSDARKLTKVQ